MTYACFDAGKIGEYLQTECYKKNDEVFRISHIPVIVPVRPPLAQVSESMPENDLIPIVLKGWGGAQSLRSGQPVPDSTPGMQIILITGDTGTGKTELCRFIEYALKHREYFLEQLKKYGRLDRRSFDEYLRCWNNVVCRRIERGHLSAVGALTIPFAMHYSPDEMSEQIRRLSPYIKKSFYSNLQIRLTTEPTVYSKLIPHIETLLSNEEKFTKIISDNLDRHLKEITIERAPGTVTLSALELVTRTDVREFGLDLKENELERVNSGLLEALARVLYSGGITGELEKFIRNSNGEGKFPVLLMDDLSLINKQNLYTIVDFLTGIAGQDYHATIVVGMTTGIAIGEETLALRSDTMKPRIYEIILSRTEGTTEWLTPEKTVNFISSYLDLIRLKDCPSKCDEPHDEVSGASPELYPFNANFIKRLAQFLPKTSYGLTPRGLLSVVYHIVTSKGKAYVGIDDLLRNQKLGEYEPYSGLSAQLTKKYPDAILAAYWYGLVEEDAFTVKASLLKALDIGYAGIPVVDGFVKIPLQYVSEPIPGEKRKSDESGDQATLVRHLTKLQQWLTDQDTMLNTDTERILQGILLSTLAAAAGSNVLDIGLIHEPSSGISLRWTYGNEPRMIIAKTIQGRSLSEPAFLVTFKDIKRLPKNITLLKLSEDDLKATLREALSEAKVSTTLLNKSPWRLRTAVLDYRQKLRSLLEEQIGSPLPRFFASCCLLLHSIRIARPLPKSKNELMNLLKTILSEQTRSDTQEFQDDNTKVTHAVHQLPVFAGLLRAFLLIQESVIDFAKADQALPGSRSDLFKTLDSCNPRVVHKGFVVQERGSQNSLSLSIQIILDGVSEIRRYKVNPKLTDELHGWQKLISIYDRATDKQLEVLRESVRSALQAEVLKQWQFPNLDHKFSQVETMPDPAEIESVKRSLDLLSGIKAEPDTEEPYLLKLNHEKLKSNEVVSYLSNLDALIGEVEKQLATASANRDGTSDIKRVLAELDRLSSEIASWIT